jgi:hypothetical protein
MGLRLSQRHAVRPGGDMSRGAQQALVLLWPGQMLLGVHRGLTFQACGCAQGWHRSWLSVTQGRGCMGLGGCGGSGAGQGGGVAGGRRGGCESYRVAWRWHLGAAAAATPTAAMLGWPRPVPGAQPPPTSWWCGAVRRVPACVASQRRCDSCSCCALGRFVGGAGVGVVPCAHTHRVHCRAGLGPPA